MQLKNRKIFLMFFLAMLWSRSAFTQAPHYDKLRIEIINGLTVKTSLVPDSIPFYGFAFRLHITNKDGKAKIDSVNLNDSSALKMIDNYDFLKNLDYSSVIGLNSDAKTIIIPVIVANFKSDENKRITNLRWKAFFTNVFRLFDYREIDGNDLSKRFTLLPFIIYSDKIVY